MNKNKSFLNVFTAIFFKVVVITVTFFSRKVLIDYLGNEINGINTLFLSIVGVLSVAELGVGSAITFCMYKPIAEGDNKQVTALYCLFIKLYRILGLIILIGGIMVIPILPYIAKDFDITFEIIISFIVILISVVLTYIFSAKISLINAYRNDFVTTSIVSTSNIIVKILQIFILIIAQSFILFLLMVVIGVLYQWILVNVYTTKYHKEIIRNKFKLESKSLENVRKNIKAMFMHKIGDILVNSLDNLLISTFISVAVLGKYSNYILVVQSMIGLLFLFFTPLTSILGHICVTQSKEKVFKIFKFMHIFNFLIGIIFFLGYYSVINPLIKLWLSDELIMDKSIVIIITISFFVRFMRQSSLAFRNATGTFYHDRFKPLVEGITNLFLSLILVKKFGINGVLMATLITNLLIDHIVEPYVIFKYIFNEKPIKYYLLNYCMIGVFVILLFVYDKINIFIFDRNVMQLIVNALVSIGITSIIMLVIYVFNYNFRVQMNELIIDLHNKIFKKKIKN